MTDNVNNDYGADKIKVLEGLSAVRKRPAMYIGSTSSPGVCITWCTRSWTTPSTRPWQATATRSTSPSHLDGSVTVVDNGRGIPTDIHPTEGKSAAEVVLTVLHAGGKFDNTSYKVSGGLHGVGVSVVNALSNNWIWRFGVTARSSARSYHRGCPEPAGHRRRDQEAGDQDHLPADDEIFETTEFSFDVLSQRLRELAFLNAGVRIKITDERDEESTTISSTRGGSSPLWSTSTGTRLASTPSRSTSRAKRGGGDRDRPAVQRFLRREGLLLCQQHQHPRRRHPPDRFQGGPDPDHEQLCHRQQPAQERQGVHLRRGPARRADRVISVKIPSPSSRGRPRPSWATPRSRGTWKP